MTSAPDEMLAKARYHRRLEDFPESEHWYKVYLLARPQDDDTRQELVAMAEFASAKSGADKVRQLANLCARHFKIKSDSAELTAAVKQSEPGEIRRKTAALNAQIVERVLEAWNLKADETPWPEALRRGEKLQNWQLVEWILRNCDVDLDTSRSFEVKVDAAELRALATGRSNSPVPP